MQWENREIDPVTLGPGHSDGKGFTPCFVADDGSSQQAEIEATTIPPPNDLESALVASLPPGNYTAIVRGTANSSGVSLVEFYNLK